MKLSLAAAALVAAVVSLPALSQISIDPSNPRPFHTIRVKAPPGGLGLDTDGLLDAWDPPDTVVTIVGNKITVSPLMRGHVDFTVPAVPFDQMIGALPPGTYQVDVIKRATGKGSSGQVGSTLTFTIATPTATEPLANYTDLWWLPEESGWGFGLFHHPTNQIFGTLFVYGADGKPTWYVMPSGQFTERNKFEGQLYRTTGPYFGGAFNPAQVQVIAAGTAVLSFDQYDLDKALLVFTIDGVTFNKSVRRQSF